MADTKITALTALTAADPINDVIPIVDVSDTSMAASGTTKKISVNNILGASGTATLASATITGDLTVDTSTLKVDSANDRVGVGTAIPGAKLTVAGASEALRLCNAAPYLTFYNAAQSSRFGYIQHNGTNLGIVNEIAGSLELYTNNTLQATLNSTGLGVGGSPVNFPNYTTIHAIGKTTTAGGVFQTSTSNNSTAARFACSSTGVDLFVETNHPLAFYTNATEKMRIDASGNVGIGVTPSAGKGCLQLSSGINFPATQVASSDANTLDDYEEGTFTPSIGGTATYTTQTGRYVKIGNRVWVTIRLVINTAGTGDDYRISGLPFVVASTIAPISVGYFAGLKISVGYISGYANTGTSTITTTATTAASANITNGAGVITNNTDLAISCFYEV